MCHLFTFQIIFLSNMYSSYFSSFKTSSYSLLILSVLLVSDIVSVNSLKSILSSTNLLIVSQSSNSLILAGKIISLSAIFIEFNLIMRFHTLSMYNLYYIILSISYSHKLKCPFASIGSLNTSTFVTCHANFSTKVLFA